MNAVDTNVLLYAVDDDKPAKRKQAREFLRQLGRTDEPLLVWQVLGEFLPGLRRWEQQRGYDPRRTRRYFQLIVSRMQIEYPSLAAPTPDSRPTPRIGPVSRSRATRPGRIGIRRHRGCRLRSW